MPSWISSNIVSLLLFIALVGAAGAFGGQWGATHWYDNLSKPDWTPPNWLFPPVWALLYLMIAVAGWFIWTSPHENRSIILGLWFAQLVLGALWSYLFFGRHEIALALADILALLVAIAAFVIAAWPANQWASLLFIPYLLWVGYATALNASIWLRNSPAV